MGSETPDHAVVGETVAAAKTWPRAQRATGFLNAVLRKVVASRDAFDAAPISHNWPVWLRTTAIQGLGVKAAESLMRAQTETPDTYLTAKDGNAHALAKMVGGEIVADYSVKVSGASIETLPGFEDGVWWVQDIAATLPARLLNVAETDRVFDICAAPGGKTMQLAARRAHVTATDRSKPRLKRLRQNLWRTGFHGEVETVLADAIEWQPPQPADKILIDAPCSALGTLRRNPEGAWIKSDADVARFGTSSPNGRKLQELALPLDIPPLEPLPSDHVLTRTFYLLQDFPGRHAGRDVWVEAAPADAEQVEGMPFRNLNDNVSPVIIGGNDWASAWAVRPDGAPLVPIGRGYSGERQRELANRFGVNLIMHVLTGNYKSDQVHVPALLDRLGQ